MSQSSRGSRAFALAILNDSLDESDLIPYLEGLVRSGYTGICPHPRDGLTVPYATRTFWRRFERLVELCLERNLEVWFYDEFPYPSGTVGGALPAGNPAARAHRLQFTDVSTELNPDGLINFGPHHILTALRYTVEPDGSWSNIQDITQDCGPHYNEWVWGPWHNKFYCGILRSREELHERASAERYFQAYLPEVPLAPNERLLAVQLVEAPSKGNIARSDIMSPEVTDEFLERIYGPLSAIAARQGLKDVPVFQDEVSAGSMWPWNRIVEKRLRQLWGEAWPLKIASLRQPGIPGWEWARHQYFEVITETIEENWFKRVAKYCSDHGLLMTGHLPGEESFFIHRPIMGDAFRTLRHFPIPGFDIISSHISDDVNRGVSTGPKVVQSSAWMEGRRPVMVEVFGANGMHTDIQKNRSTLAWVAAHDITLAFDHSTYQCMRGLRKYDAPPVNNRFNPLDAGRADLWAWYDWYCDLLEDFKFDPDTLILFPVDSLSRFHPDEYERWAPDTNLLETWFYFAGINLDNLFVPPHRLSEIKPVEGGFEFQGQTFTQFLVPPVRSLVEGTWEALQSLAQHEGFTWTLPLDAEGVTVFGENVPLGAIHPVPGQVLHSDEASLLEAGVAGFSTTSDIRLSEIKSSQTILKSLRLNPETGEQLLVLLNPYPEAIEVQLPPHIGKGLLWSGGETVAPTASENGSLRVTLAPRDVRLFHWQNESGELSLAAFSNQLEPTHVDFRWLAPNLVKLSQGEAVLSDRDPVPFQPAPISALWDLPGIDSVETAPYAPRHSSAKLERPSDFRATFPIQLQSDLAELAVLIDWDSLPPSAQIFWDQSELSPIARLVFDATNQVHPIPAHLLTPGSHRLVITGEVSNGMDGLHERPILVGDFILASPENETPILASRPAGWQPIETVTTWDRSGAPQAFGPGQYRLLFDVTSGATSGQFLDLGSFMGVAEVVVNGTFAGRSNWEPRRLALPELVAGENEIRVTLYGSWNNVLSDLNPLQNGLTSTPVLVR